MSKEELKDKYTERAKIFHQAMVSCHRISPIDCIEWFADRIADLEKENAELKNKLEHRNCLDCSNHSSKLRMRNLDLEKENAKLRKDKKELCHSISEGGKACVYLNDQLTKAKEIIKKFLLWENDWHNKTENKYELLKQAEQFISEIGK